MVAYDIDTAAVMAAARDTAAELAPLASVATDLQGTVDAVESALGANRVAGAFASYARDTLLPDVHSALSRADAAVQGVRAAVAEYLRGDEEMRLRAQAAAAAVPTVLPVRAAPPVPVDPPVLVDPLVLVDPPVLADPLPAPMPELSPPRQAEPEPERLVPLPGPPPWRPKGPFQPVLPGHPPFEVARNLMLWIHFPCPGIWNPYPDCFRGRSPGRWWPGPEIRHPRPELPGKEWPDPGPETNIPGPGREGDFPIPRVVPVTPWEPPQWHSRIPGVIPLPSPWNPKEWQSRNFLPAPCDPLPRMVARPGALLPPDQVSQGPARPRAPEREPLPIAAELHGRERLSGEKSGGIWGLT